MTNARAAWDQEQIGRAVEFTTSRFQGRGLYDTRRFATRSAAEDDARGDRRAMVYAVTPEGWSIHIVNGDAIPMEKTMTELTKTYSSKSNAIRAARAALKDKYRDPMSGVHFRIEPAGEEFAWHEINPATGEVAQGERVEDGVASPAPGALPVVELPNDTRSPARKKADAQAQREGFPNATRAAEARRARAAKAGADAPAAKAPPKKQAALEAAQRGELPTPPDFSAETHKRWRKTLEELVTAAEAGDLAKLKADKTEPKSSSRVAICRYRDLAITALQARKAQAKAA